MERISGCRYSKAIELTVHSRSVLGGESAQDEYVSRREFFETRPSGTLIAGCAMSSADCGQVAWQSMEQLTFNFSFASAREIVRDEESRQIDFARYGNISFCEELSLQDWQHTQTLAAVVSVDAREVPNVCSESADAHPAGAAPIYRFALYWDARQRAARLSLYDKILQHAKSLPW